MRLSTLSSGARACDESSFLFFEKWINKARDIEAFIIECIGGKRAWLLSEWREFVIESLSLLFFYSWAGASAAASGSTGADFLVALTRFSPPCTTFMDTIMSSTLRSRKSSWFSMT